MRMLITLDYPPDRGGIQHYLYSIVQHHYTKNDIVLTTAPPKEKVTHLTPSPARILRIGAGSHKTGRKWRIVLSIVVALYRLRQTVKGITLIECGNIYAAVPVWFTRILHRKPYRVYTYGTELLALPAPGFKNAFLRRVLSKAEIIYSLGSYTESLVRACGIRRPVEHRPPWISLSGTLCHGKARRDRYEVLTVGRLVQHKKHRDLLAAISLLVPSKPWSVIIVGEGPQRSGLTRSSEILHLSSRVTLTGEISDNEKAYLYRRAGIFALTSMETPEGTEGFGIVLLEAMVHRIPIVAYATGEIPRILGNGTCGLLVPPGDIIGLSKALSSIQTRRRETLRRVHNAYDRVSSVYSRATDRAA